MIFSQYRVYLVLAVLMISSWLLADFYEEDLNEPVKFVDHSPDYFSTGYYKKEMTKQGKVKNELTADKMIHYSDDGKTHLDHPLMTLYNSESPPWVIASEKAVLEADGDHLLLTGLVFIRRDGVEHRQPFKINSRDLQVVLSTGYAETDQWTEVIDGINRTEGVGMQAFFVEPVRLKLLSKIKGRYEFN